MWAGPSFWIADNCAIDVRNVVAARSWYKEKLGLREIHDRKEDDSGRPFADVCVSASRGMGGGLFARRTGTGRGSEQATCHFLYEEARKDTAMVGRSLC
jgi:catechol 2,3-dioxygenase-like lactoylglutathione lyase family enzyme